MPVLHNFAARLDRAFLAFNNEVEEEDWDDNEVIESYDEWEEDEYEYQGEQYIPRPMDFCFTINGVDAFVEFRFHMPEIIYMVRALRMQLTYHSDCGYAMSGLEGLCLVLNRLALGSRLVDNAKIFGSSKARLSTMFNVILKEIYLEWKHLLLWDHVQLTPAFMERMGMAVYAKTSQEFDSRRDVWAFLDGTNIQVCRPREEDQGELYNGYKKFHSIKYQALVSPDAIVRHLGGPFSGRKHDQRMLTDSKLRDYLVHHSHNTDGDPMCVYGDEGYQRLAPVHAPYRGGRLSPLETWSNGDMRRPRLCVEWAFGHLSNHWTFVNNAARLRVGLMPVGIFFPVMVLFSNLQICFGRNCPTRSYYRVDAPQVHEYLTPKEVWENTREIFSEPDYFGDEVLEYDHFPEEVDGEELPEEIGQDE